MNSPAFAVTHGMFPRLATDNLTKSKFTTGTCTVTPAKPVKSTNTITMADPFQRRFQTPGRIGIDYSRPRKLAYYVRSGYSTAISYPSSPAYAGHYSLSNCGIMGGSKKILMKADEFMARNVMRQYKEFSVPNGVYAMKCTEGTVGLQAEEKRVFSRLSAFRQAQKPVNIRLREQYDARKKCFIAANGCDAEEEKFKVYPMSARVYTATRNEAMGTCTRYVAPQSVAENYMSNAVMNRVKMESCPYGEYLVGACTEGYVKHQAEERRLAVLAAEYRETQMGPAETTRVRYDTPKVAISFYRQDAREAYREEKQYFDMPAVAAAMMRD